MLIAAIALALPAVNGEGITVTDWDGFQARVHPGTGIVARTAGGALVMPLPAGQQQTVVQLLELIRTARPGGGRVLARKVAGILAAAEADETLELALLAPLGGEDVAVLVVGDLDVSAETAEGAVTVSGRDSLTWVDRVLRAPSALVVTSPAGVAAAVQTSDLVAGIVPGGGLSLAPREGAAFVAPIPAPLPESLQELMSPAPEPPPADAPRPPLGVLVFDDGSVYELEQDYVLGRQPEGAPEVISGAASPLRLEDSGGTVSRAHALISLEGCTVRLSDHGSSNGTYIAPPNSSDWQPVPPNGRVVLAPGTTIKLGNRTLKYESDRGRR